MPLSRRYTPEHPPQDNCIYGMDFSYVLPPGVSISGGQLDIFWNLASPVAADADFTKGAINNTGRILWCSLTGGVEGRDYQLRWECFDTEGNTFQRTGLVLCAQTS